MPVVAQGVGDRLGDVEIVLDDENAQRLAVSVGVFLCSQSQVPWSPRIEAGASGIPPRDANAPEFPWIT
jgi:hypothetical protein